MCNSYSRPFSAEAADIHDFYTVLTYLCPAALSGYEPPTRGLLYGRHIGIYRMHILYVAMIYRGKPKINLSIVEKLNLWWTHM